VLLHHHVGKLPDAQNLIQRVKGAVFDSYMIALDGRALLELLAAYQRRDATHNAVLVLHGHKHLYFHGSYTSRRGGRVQVHAHPSSTMGHEIGGELDAIPRFSAVQLSEEGRWSVECCEWPRASTSERRRPPTDPQPLAPPP
jgi:hypothetical protein